MGYFVTLTPAGDITDLFLDAPGYAPPPPEAVPVPDAVGEQLRTSGFAGKRWVGGVLSDAPPVPPPDPPPFDQVAAAAATHTQAKAQMLDLFRLLDSMQVSALTTGQQITVNAQQIALASAIETCKQQLRDISVMDLSAATSVAEMQNLIFAAYVAARNAAPVEIQSAFQSLVP